MVFIRCSVRATGKGLVAELFVCVKRGQAWAAGAPGLHLGHLEEAFFRAQHGTMVFRRAESLDQRGWVEGTVKWPHVGFRPR